MNENSLQERSVMIHDDLVMARYDYSLLEHKLFRVFLVQIPAFEERPNIFQCNIKDFAQQIGILVDNNLKKDLDVAITGLAQKKIRIGNTGTGKTVTIMPFKDIAYSAEEEGRVILAQFSQEMLPYLFRTV